jgi:hypothetical protein
MRLANGYADALSSLVYADADRKDEHCHHAPSSANVSILLSTVISGSEWPIIDSVGFVQNCTTIYSLCLFIYVTVGVRALDL